MVSTNDRPCRRRPRPARLAAGVLLAVAALGLAAACSVSYKFTGTSINYDLIKSIRIEKIVNRAPYGWAPMEAMLNNKLTDIYAQQTRLQLVKRGGDLRLEGEITAYDQFNKAVSGDGYSAQVQLRLTVNIRFQNTKTGESWERPFSATSQYDSTRQLADVQEALVTEMIKDLTDQIFNATVADW